MAAGQNQRNRKNDPMLTKTGKARLGPLNVAQLTKLMESATKPKTKAKVRARAKQARAGCCASIIQAFEA
jgi:hypothetical protein